MTPSKSSPVRRAAYIRYRPRLELLEQRLALNNSLFTQTLITGGLDSPSAITFTPDGRLFVAEQGGEVRIIKNGVLLPKPFLQLDVNQSFDLGLLGITPDPQFSTTPYIYVHYTPAGASTHNRISRFTAAGDEVVPGSEVVLIELDELTGPTNHVGGAIRFGADRKLYIPVGENGIPSKSQRLDNLMGKVLRINSDGSVPSDNPFVDVSGARDEIWTLGLRNPYNLATQPDTGRIFLNDVGSSGDSRREEVNELTRGANYGWPIHEGYSDDPAYVSPLFAYGDGFGGNNCSIIGAAFYNPQIVQFPSSYVGSYFFGDFCGQWLMRRDSNTGAVTKFIDDTFGVPIDLAVAADGSVYYATWDGGEVYRIYFKFISAIPSFTPVPPQPPLPSAPQPSRETAAPPNDVPARHPMQVGTFRQRPLRSSAHPPAEFLACWGAEPLPNACSVD